MKSEVKNQITDPWHHSQSWQAYGHQWKFTYCSLTANYTIKNDDSSLILKIPIVETNHFLCPQAWLDHWAKSKEGRSKLKPSQQPEQPSLFSEQGKNNQAQKEPITVEVVDNQPTQSQELTDDEARDRLFLERKVERAFYEAGKALQELRDRRLYRSSHANFESYCLERFGFKRRHPYRLIDAAQVFDNLIEMCPNWTQNENVSEVESHEASEELQMCPNWTQILPTTEYQIRPLTCLDPEQQAEAWTQAVENAGGKVPSHRIVKSIVDQIRERTKIPNPWRVGEVATIIVKDNPDLRGKGGCWAIISEVHDFSCTVKLWDGEYQVRIENLKKLSYETTDKEQKFFRELSDRLRGIFDDRLSKIQLNEVEKPTKDFLAGLGKIDRPYLTELEERLLRVLD